VLGEFKHRDRESFRSDFQVLHRRGKGKGVHACGRGGRAISCPIMPSNFAIPAQLLQFIGSNLIINFVSVLVHECPRTQVAAHLASGCRQGKRYEQPHGIEAERPNSNWSWIEPFTLQEFVFANQRATSPYLGSSTSEAGSDLHATYTITTQWAKAHFSFRYSHPALHIPIWGLTPGRWRTKRKKNALQDAHTHIQESGDRPRLKAAT